MKVLIATSNSGKTAEYDALLASLSLSIVTLRDLAIDVRVEETGSTFEENARMKARAYADASGLWTLADDSGLCVDVLGGAPGIYSARYAPGASARIERLLDKMRHVPDDQRTARFVCVIALAEPGGETFTFEGTCEGRIAWQASGDSGFGYDPIFYLPEYGRTMAALPISVKNRVSHRARAAAKLKRWLLEEPRFPEGPRSEVRG